MYPNYQNNPGGPQGGAGYPNMGQPAQNTGYANMPPMPNVPYPNMGQPMQNTGYANMPPMPNAPYPNMNQPTQNTAGMPPMQGTGYANMPPMPNASYPNMNQPMQGAGYQNMAQPGPNTGYANMPPMPEAGYQNMPPMQPEQPVNEKPPRRGLSLFQIAVIVCAVGLVAWYLITTLVPARTNYATIQVGMLGARYSGDALIVRNETPYDAEGVTRITYIADEGMTVARGLAICDVFSSGYSNREITSLQDYRDQIRDYQLSLLNAETTYDARMARVESDVLARAREVRSMLAGARGNLQNQEMLLKAAITARQQYLKTKYANDQRMSRLLDDERAQKQRISSWTKQYAATSESIISFYSDGYEYGLTTSNYDQFTPAEVRRMMNGEKPAASALTKGKTTIYRTIRDGHWNVLFLVDDTNWNPVEGQVYELQLEHFENTTVQATVESFTRSGGELLVRLSVDSSVTPVLYMRTCQAELGDYLATLMVPSRAIYTQDEMQGVVVIDGSNQLFIPVQIVYQDGDNMYVTAVTQGLLFEGQTVRLF